MLRRGSTCWHGSSATTAALDAAAWRDVRHASDAPQRHSSWPPRADRGSAPYDDDMAVRSSGVRQQSVWASVVSDDARRLRDWLMGLGFTEDLLIPGESAGSIHHCQLDWPEGGRIMLSSTGERSTPCRPGTSSLHVVTADPDRVMSRARSLGATIVQELVDQTDYPSRDFTVADPDGNHWTFATFAG